MIINLTFIRYYFVFMDLLKIYMDTSSSQHNISKLSSTPSQPLSFRDLLPRERIKLDVRVDTWQDAIREAGKLLLSSHSITPEYIDAMICTAEELGPYIVIAKGIAMPHASPESGAIKTALSLVRLSTPIEFGNPDNDPVQLVFGLVATDGKIHINAMRTLAELIMNKEKIAQLFTAPDIDSICNLLF